jgi:hypothetical protein
MALAGHDLIVLALVSGSGREGGHSSVGSVAPLRACPGGPHVCVQIPGVAVAAGHGGEAHLDAPGLPRIGERAVVTAEPDVDAGVDAAGAGEQIRAG